MKVNSTLYALRSTPKQTLLMLYFLSVIVLLSAVSVSAQTIQIRENINACYTTIVQNFTFSSSSGSPVRNTYTGTNFNGNNPMRVIWVVGSSRWEIQQFFVGSWVWDYYSTFASYPNPPDLATGNWQKDPACTGTLVQFDGTGTQIVLPIELAQFDVKNTEGAKNHLTWRTASEKDNSHFDIERSTDGTTFHSIGQVKGNNKPSSYQYTDAAPFTTSYYRLKQVDFDGTATYSKVVSVEQKGKGKGLKVYPTLVSNGLLTVDTEGGDYSIYNIVGQQVQSGTTAQRLDVSALAKGTYILKVGTEQAKFVKQ